MQVGRAWQGPAGTQIVYRDAECVAQIRCDRATALGNPYVMCEETQRDAVCDAFESLFHDNLVGLWGVFVVGTGRYVPTLLPTVGDFDSIVSLIGESAGFEGVVERWDPCAARRELTRLHDLMWFRDASRSAAIVRLGGAIWTRWPGTSRDGTRVGLRRVMART